MRVLEDKLALVTGGARGIGRATVLALAEAGADVAINYRHSKGAAEELADIVRKYEVKAAAFQADIAHEDQVQNMMAEIHAKFEQRRIQILVNNAGINRDRSFLRMSRDLWDEVMNTNLNGMFNVTKGVLPQMLDAGWGRIINLTSVVGQTGNFGQTNFATAKAGTIGFTMTLAREVARKGICVNAIAPGYIDTDMTRDVPTSVIDQVKSMTPIGRLGRPEEVAQAILFLASPKTGYITGQVISVNGGMYM